MHLNLYIVDDDEPVRRSLGNLLLSRGHAVRTFESGQDFLQHADLGNAGVVILDLRMEGPNGDDMSGLEVFQILRERSSPLVVLFLSGHGDIPTAVQAVENGAVGWLPKPCTDDELLRKLERAREIARHQMDQRQAKATTLALWNKLTEREMQVAKPYAQGLSSKRISQVLSAQNSANPIDHRTVENHIGRIRAKLGVESSNALQQLFGPCGLL
jgi:two-component system response regulator TtrR